MCVRVAFTLSSLNKLIEWQYAQMNTIHVGTKVKVEIYAALMRSKNNKSPAKRFS